MPRGQYARQRIPVRRFSITFHEIDFPAVEDAARRSGLSVARFIRRCVFEKLGRQESHRQSDRRS